jgi:hypothetical protein
MRNDRHLAAKRYYRFLEIAPRGSVDRGYVNKLVSRWGIPKPKKEESE